MHINPNEDLGMQLDKLVDPLHARATEEEEKQPEQIDMPPVPHGWSWDKQITELLKEFEGLWEEWAEANAHLADVHDSYRNARAQDDAAIAKAARDGAKQHPGRKAEGKLAQELEWALEVCIAKRLAVNALVRRRSFVNILRAGLDSYLEQLHRHARTAEGILAEDLESFRERWSEHRTYALRTAQTFDWLSGLISEKYRVHSGEHVFDPIPELRLPHPREVKLTKVLHVIDTLPYRGVPTKE